MANWRSYTEVLFKGLQWARSYYGLRLTGTIALLTDILSEGANQAVKARMEASDTFPADALGYVGSNKNLERYPGDTDATFKARTLAAFGTWIESGTKQAIEDELERYGYATAAVYEDADWSRPPQPYWSQFWVVFPDGTHTVAVSTQLYGDPGEVYGAGRLYGISGITAEELDGLKRLIKKWKPARSICRQLIFESGGVVYGSGHTYGESGLTYGGAPVYVDGL